MGRRPLRGPPETGDAGQIRLADIVSGKPVPPRPSVRHRVSTRAAEQHTLTLWPGLETEPLGEWVLRTDPAPVGRLLKRANSCLAIGDPGVDLAEADGAGPGASTAPATGSRWPRSSAAPTSTRRWRRRLGAGAGRRRRLPDRLALPGAAGGPDRGHRARAVTADGDRVLAEIDGVASGRASLDGDWLGLHGLTVDPAHRRRGRGTAVVAALLEWGAERGATTAWLHVEVDNEPGLALYEGLGFRTHHTCRYLAPG